MQIGNNRPNGLQPRDNNKPLLDPDLTRSNREGLESTTRVSSAKVQEAAQKLSEVKGHEARAKTTDTFERSKPQDDPGMDVAERIKNARSQQIAKRLDNAREQSTEARSEAASKGQRIASARTQQAETNGQRITNARAQHAEAKGEDTKVREDMGRSDGITKAEAGRIDAARTQSAETSATATRIKNARTDYRAAQIDLPGAGGRPETSSARSMRIEGLRQAHEAGSLNTPERASQSASRLLGGE